MVPYNSNSPIYSLVVPVLDTGTVEERLTFVQSLQAVIAGQNITNAQGAYAITKNPLRYNMLTVFKIMEGNNRSQIEPNYNQTMKDVHIHMFSLQAYITQL
eukprot:3132191-Ditylum_brightwellii.AAC.1